MNEKPQNLQDTFLNAVRKSKTAVTIYLVNGVKLQGNITWFDNFCVLLRRDGQVQLVYKHAISTVMPMGPSSFRSRMRPRVKPTRAPSRKSRGAGHSSHVTTRAVVLHVARKTNTDSSRSEKSRLEEAIASHRRDRA